jgi:hypothetical protein
MPVSTRKTMLAGALSLLVLLGIGLATYLLGGGTAARPPGDGVPRIDLSKSPVLSYEPTEALRLRWGRGRADAWVDTRWFGPTLDTFAIDDMGGPVIVDHPAWHQGARVRRFARDGRLERTWLTQPGSVFFEPFGTGIMFVTAPGKGGTERVRLVSEDGSVRRSFPVPAGVNSTALFRVGDLLGVTSEVPQVSNDPNGLRIESRFFPVVLLTPQGPESAPVQTGEGGYRADTEGRIYQRVVESSAWAVQADSTQTVTLADGRALRLPGLATPVGVDRDVVWMVMPQVTAPDTVIERPGWPMGRSGEVEVIAARVDGTYLARVIVPWSPLLGDVKRRLYVTRDTLWVLSGDREGVSLLRYRAARR